MTTSLEEHSAAEQFSGAYIAFLCVAGVAYVCLLAFVFAYGIYGEVLTAGVDDACAEAAFDNGKEQEALGNLDAALQRYRQALQGEFQDPERKFQCLRSIGEVESRLGRYEEAIELYKSLPPGAMTQPGHFAAYVNSLSRAGHADALDVARVWVEKSDASEDTQQQVWAHSTIGRIHEDRGEMDDALTQYDFAAKLDPEGAAALYGAQLVQSRGDYEEAVKRLNRFLQRVKSGQLRQNALQLRARFKKLAQQASE